MRSKNIFFSFYLFYKLAVLSFIALLSANFLFIVGKLQKISLSTRLLMISIIKWVGLITLLFGIYLLILGILVRPDVRVRTFSFLFFVICILLGGYFFLQFQLLETFSTLDIK